MTLVRAHWTTGAARPKSPVASRRARAARAVCQCGAVPDAEAAYHKLVSSIEYPMLIVTTATETERSGCLVGFSTQASMRPPRFLVFLSKSNHTTEVASLARILVVHFLQEDNHDLASLFGEETGDEVDKFAHCDWHRGPGGSPILAGVAGWIAGPVLGRFDMGDHVGHLIDLDEAHAGETGRQLGSQEVRDLEPGHPA